MLPENRLSKQAVLDQTVVEFVNPVRQSLLLDYERGGVRLHDNTEGLNNYVWHSQYHPDSGQVILSNGQASHTVFSVKNITELAFAFDINMQPIVAYVVDNTTYLYYSDSASTQFITICIGNNLINPRLTLDDRRSNQSSNADVLLAYVKDNVLCVRNQRERYTIEHELGEVTNQGRLWHVSMMNNYRVGFMFKN